MRSLLWFLLGVVLSLAGQAVAQNYWGTDNQGNSMTLYELTPNTYGWYDNQGRSGMWQQMPNFNSSPRNPC